MELYTNASNGGSLNITEGLPDLSVCGLIINGKWQYVANNTKVAGDR